MQMDVAYHMSYDEAFDVQFGKLFLVEVHDIQAVSVVSLKIALQIDQHC